MLVLLGSSAVVFFFAKLPFRLQAAWQLSSWNRLEEALQATGGLAVGSRFDGVSRGFKMVKTVLVFLRSFQTDGVCHKSGGTLVFYMVLQCYKKAGIDHSKIGPLHQSFPKKKRPQSTRFAAEQLEAAGSSD